MKPEPSRFLMTIMAVLSMAFAGASPAQQTRPIFRVGQAPALAPGATSSTNAVNMITVDYAPGMTLGAGYDPLTLNVKEQCIAFQVKAQPTPSDSENDVSVVTSEEDIQNDIDVSYAESMGLGAFSASANVQFANSVDYESSSVTVIAHVRVTSSIMNTVDQTSVQLNVRGTDYGAMMAANYNQFRAICGDYYVAGIVTGGDYAGALSIKKNLFATTTTAALQLAQSASAALASESTSGSIQDTLTSLQSQGVVEVSELWKGGPNGSSNIKPASTVAQLFNNYANSFVALQSTTNPVQVHLLPYGGLTSNTVPDLSSDYANVELLAGAYINYLSVQRDMAYLAAHPGEYANPPDPAQVQGWLNAISSDINSVQAQIKNCADPAQPCPASIPGATTPDAYQKLIPQYLGLPQLCLHIAVNDPTAPSGLYTLYLNGDATKPMQLYCQLGNDPQAYVPLTYTGSSVPVAWDQWPSSNGHQYNYSQQYWTNMMATLYTKIAINESTLQVDPNDTTFAVTYGPVDPGSNNFVPYGTAGECLQFQQIGHSNIDLRGTAFAIDTSKTSWIATGYEMNTNGCCPGSATYDDTTNAKVQQVSIASNSGRCGAFMPWAAADNAHNLYLKWVGATF